MRISTIVTLLAFSLLLVAACGTTEPSRTTSRKPMKLAGKNLKPGDVKAVADPTIVTWRSFKTVNARTGKKMLTHMHLINRAHPDAKRPISLDSYKKVLSNEQMGAVLAVLREAGYSKHAKSGLVATRVPKGTANGIIVVQRGSRTWGLPFLKGREHASSASTEAYLKCKSLISNVFSTADQFQVYTSDGDRVLGIKRIRGGIER